MKRIIIILIMSALFFLTSAFIFDYKYQQMKSAEAGLGESYNNLVAITKDCESYLNSIDVIYKYAKEYNVPPEVIIAVMKIESGFDVNADSGSSYGLMQINNIHLKDFENKMDILDVNRNVEKGTSILSGLKSESDDLHYILNSYNMGEYGYKEYVNETGKITRAYSRKVIEILNQLNK